MTGSGTRVSIAPLGDEAILLALDGDREQCNSRIGRLAGALVIAAEREPSSGIADVVPAMTSLAVFFDARKVSADAVRRRLLALVEQIPDGGEDDRKGRLHVVPVVYDGDDLAAVAQRLSLSPLEVVRRHAAREYRVRFLGFAPGFAYLGPLDPSLVLSRRADPRPRVHAGSVAIAGDQTAVYPLDTPGGWHLVGRTTVRPFDPARSPPSLFQAGDRVRFEPVGP